MRSTKPLNLLALTHIITLRHDFLKTFVLIDSRLTSELFPHTSVKASLLNKISLVCDDYNLKFFVCCKIQFISNMFDIFCHSWYKFCVCGKQMQTAPHLFWRQYNKHMWISFAWRVVCICSLHTRNLYHEWQKMSNMLDNRILRHEQQKFMVPAL